MTENIDFREIQRGIEITDYIGPRTCGGADCIRGVDAFGIAIVNGDELRIPLCEDCADKIEEWDL